MVGTLRKSVVMKPISYAIQIFQDDDYDFLVKVAKESTKEAWHITAIPNYEGSLVLLSISNDNRLDFEENIAKNGKALFPYRKGPLVYELFKLD